MSVKLFFNLLPSENKGGAGCAPLDPRLKLVPLRFFQAGYGPVQVWH